MPYGRTYGTTYPPGASVPVGAYPAVYPWIAQCLQDSAKNVDDDYFDLAIKAAIRDNLGKAAPKAGFATGAELYASLTGEDLDRVSQAIGLLVSADWQPSLTTGGAGGDLVSEATEQVKRAFASAAPLRSQWRTKARRLLAACAFSPPASRTPTISGANGPTRVERERLRELGYGYGEWR